MNSSPAIALGLAYVSSVDGNVYAVDTATGAERWVFATKKRAPIHRAPDPRGDP